MDVMGMPAPMMSMQAMYPGMAGTDGDLMKVCAFWISAG